jgi:hypothetical protein
VLRCSPPIRKKTKSLSQSTGMGAHSVRHTHTLSHTLSHTTCTRTVTHTRTYTHAQSHAQTHTLLHVRMQAAQQPTPWGAFTSTRWWGGVTVGGWERRPSPPPLTLSCRRCVQVTCALSAPAVGDGARCALQYYASLAVQDTPTALTDTTSLLHTVEARLQRLQAASAVWASSSGISSSLPTGALPVVSPGRGERPGAGSVVGGGDGTSGLSALKDIRQRLQRMAHGDAAAPASDGRSGGTGAFPRSGRGVGGGGGGSGTSPSPPDDEFEALELPSSVVPSPPESSTPAPVGAAGVATAPATSPSLTQDAVAGQQAALPVGTVARVAPAQPAVGSRPPVGASAAPLPPQPPLDVPHTE